MDSPINVTFRIVIYDGNFIVISSFVAVVKNLIS